MSWRTTALLLEVRFCKDLGITLPGCMNWEETQKFQKRKQRWFRHSDFTVRAVSLEQRNAPCILSAQLCLAAPHLRVSLRQTEFPCVFPTAEQISREAAQGSGPLTPEL